MIYIFFSIPFIIIVVWILFAVAGVFLIIDNIVNIIFLIAGLIFIGVAILFIAFEFFRGVKSFFNLITLITLFMFISSIVPFIEKMLCMSRKYLIQHENLRKFSQGYETKLYAVVIGLITVILLLMIYYVNDMLESSIGNIIIILAIALTILGSYFISQRISIKEIEKEKNRYATEVTVITDNAKIYLQIYCDENLGEKPYTIFNKRVVIKRMKKGEKLFTNSMIINDYIEVYNKSVCGLILKSDLSDSIRTIVKPNINN